MHKALMPILMVSNLLAAFSHAANERQTLKGLVPEVVAQLQPVGRLNGSLQLKLAIGVAPRDEKALDAFVQQVSDPASPNYRHYLASPPSSSPKNLARLKKITRPD